MTTTTPAAITTTEDEFTITQLKLVNPKSVVRKYHKRTRICAHCQKVFILKEVTRRKYCYTCQNQHYPNDKEKMKQYYQANKDKICQQKKQWRETNHEKILQQQKQYRQQNKDRINAKAKERYQKNREKILQQQKRYYQKKTKKNVEEQPAQ